MLPSYKGSIFYFNYDFFIKIVKYFTIDLFVLYLPVYYNKDNDIVRLLS